MLAVMLATTLTKLDGYEHSAGLWVAEGVGVGEGVGGGWARWCGVGVGDGAIVGAMVGVGDGWRSVGVSGECSM